eukprot:SAG11_NODE_18691_length_483_cov_4.166667_1_plen_23_part_01
MAPKIDESVALATSLRSKLIFSI